MTANPDDAVPAVNDRYADAFGPVTLASFAQNPSGAHIFRAQHQLLIDLMNVVIRNTETGIDNESALRSRNALTSLSSLFEIHQSLEESLIHRGLSGEPRARMTAEQFEREMVPLAAEFSAFARHFPTASSILRSSSGEFSAAASALFARVHERFRREERDLFPLFDRVSGGSTPVVS